MKTDNLTEQEKTAIALKLGSTANFFKTYFNYLPHFKTYNYGEPKYSSYHSFKAVMYRDSKKYR